MLSAESLIYLTLIDVVRNFKKALLDLFLSQKAKVNVSKSLRKYKYFKKIIANIDKKYYAADYGVLKST